MRLRAKDPITPAICHQLFATTGNPHQHWLSHKSTPCGPLKGNRTDLRIFLQVVAHFLSDLRAESFRNRRRGAWSTLSACAPWIWTGMGRESKSCWSEPSKTTQAAPRAPNGLDRKLWASGSERGFQEGSEVGDTTWAYCLGGWRPTKCLGRNLDVNVHKRVLKQKSDLYIDLA